MSNADRLTAAITAAQEAVHEMRFGRILIASNLLEESLKIIYSIKKQESHPLLDLSGQGR